MEIPEMKDVKIWFGCCDLCGRGVVVVYTHVCILQHVHVHLYVHVCSDGDGFEKITLVLYYN